MRYTTLTSLLPSRFRGARRRPAIDMAAALAILATSFFAMLPNSVVSAEPLTVARIFADPDLAGPRLRAPKFSPDGRYVTYLQGKPDNKDQLDLWAFDTELVSRGIPSGQRFPSGAHPPVTARMLVDSRKLVGDEGKLSAEEEARRERQRTAALRGIVEYEFSSDGRQLLIPLGGDLYLYDLTARTQPVKRLTASEAYETDARFSPEGMMKGSMLSPWRRAKLWSWA
mgnify:CR=1 FL=1